MPSFKFTKKMKNRMKNDTAAIIALAKSTGDCCEAASMGAGAAVAAAASDRRGDTEALIVVGPKLVYEERTHL
jgi:hypothetical protein